jgi:hypothetical protein
MRFLRVFLPVVCFLFPLWSDAQVPAMNDSIIKYVNTVIGKKVGRGECWDLAHDALTLVNAAWDHQYIYGKVVNPETDTIYPGDIIQFEKVTIKYTQGTSTFTESYPHHTAIVYEVTAPGVYRIAHQNNGFSGKKVGISSIRLVDKKSGKMKFYRPVPGP